MERKKIRWRFNLIFFRARSLVYYQLNDQVFKLVGTYDHRFGGICRSSGISWSKRVVEDFNQETSNWRFKSKVKPGLNWPLSNFIIMKTFISWVQEKHSLLKNIVHLLVFLLCSKICIFLFYTKNSVFLFHIKIHRANERGFATT